MSKPGPSFGSYKKTTMENRLYKAPANFYCNCPNQLLLVPGCECDLCMGIVADYDTTAPIATTDRYDESYFEALERLYCSFEFAA
jgi:hypothetical protein